MKRVWKISESELPLLRAAAAKPKTLASQTPFSITNNSLIKTCINRLFLRDSYCSQTNINSNPFPNIIGLFADSWSHADIQAKQDLLHKVSLLRDELIRVNNNNNIINNNNNNSQDEIFRVLDEKGTSWFKGYPDGAAFVELLEQLEPWPHCALEVCNWRRKKADNDFPMTSREYAKGIRIASRSKNIDLAADLFTEAANKRIKTASIYNELMAAYMYNEDTDKCQLLFRDFKNDKSCKPTVVTYNILLSVFGRLMLIDHMEAVLQEMKNSNILPNLKTYNMLLSGYVTAWMWDNMEETYVVMGASGIEPDIRTHMLMLRGYIHCCNLKKMEEIYELVKYHVIEHKEFSLIRAMIFAYCKSTSRNRVKKVEELLWLIPKNDYKPWLNVILITLYAKEDIMDVMESYIDEAFERNTSIATVGVMHCIIACYFRGNAVDKLANFLKRAEYAEWKLSRTLYHCKMVMYFSQKRLAEMEDCLGEMRNFNIQPSKKTFIIMCKAYLAFGQKHKLDQVLGVMCTNGFGILSNTLNS